jgi:ABC-type antimicrobial peptide transport system permease subunit
MLRTLGELSTVNPGFNPHNVLNFGLTFPPSFGVEPPNALREHFRQITADLESVPGAGGALLLAIIGIYAVMTFSVSQRTQEIAIRMTLGAQRADVATLVLLSGAKLVLLGCSLGVVGSLAVSRVVSSFLFGVSATDPFVYSGAVLLMILLALLASASPAMRAI